jgi:hypothetical protein
MTLAWREWSEALEGAAPFNIRRARDFVRLISRSVR